MRYCTVIGMSCSVVDDMHMHASSRNPEAVHENMTQRHWTNGVHEKYKSSLVDWQTYLSNISADILAVGCGRS